MTTTGIYKIQSLIHPDRCYIGSAVNIKQRWRGHQFLLKNNKHDNPIIQNHYNKYGKDDLQFSIIESFEFISKEHLLQREQHYLDTTEHYFNILKIAGSILGFKHSKETCDRMSILKMGNKNMLGHHHSEESKQKISEKKLGKCFMSEEDKVNMSKRIINNTYAAGGKGKIVSEKTKELLRQKNLGMNNPQFGKKQLESSNHLRSQSIIYYLLEKELTNYINTYQ
jgi:hypothetical protein